MPNNPKCYFGCAGDWTVHKFPDWTNHHQTDRFNQWKMVLDPELQERGNNYIFNMIRLCDRHFEYYYKSQTSQRLTRNAVPTLNLVSAASSEAQLEARMTPEVQPEASTSSEEKLSPSVIDDMSATFGNLTTASHSVSSNELKKKRPYSVAFPAQTSSTQDLEKHQNTTKKVPTRVAGCKKQPHFKCDIFKNTVTKLKERIEKLKSVCKSQRKQVLAAKKLSRSKTFMNVFKNMPDPIKTFTKMQLQFRKKSRGRRFSQEEKIISLSIYKQGPKAYKFLSKLFVLPSKRSLQKLLAAITFEPGINKHILEDLKNIVKKMSQEKRKVILLFDEMAVQPALSYNATQDKIAGFEDFGDEKTNKIADHTLVFMLKGVKGKVKQPICFTFCQSATKRETLKRLLTTLIRQLRDIGLEVVATVCDQSTTNMSVIKNLQQNTKEYYLRQGKTFDSNAFEIDKIKVFPLFDPPHLLKCVRNNLLTKNATFIQNGQMKTAKWEHLKMLLELDEGEDDIRILNKLTENHVIKDKIPKMRVKYATQVFSQRVSAVMRFLAKRNILPPECADTAEFLLIFDKLFDSFNGHSYQDTSKIYKSCMKTNSPHFKLWTDMLPILESIKFQCIKKKNNVDVIKNESIPSIKNWIHNMKCFKEMFEDLKKNHNISNLLTRNFNQDPLENFFSSIRSHGARNTNPTCLQFISTFKTLIVNNLNSPHSPGANCEKDDDQCMQSLKQLITANNEISRPDFACDVDPFLDVISEFQETENQVSSILHTESKKYVTGYVIKKCKTQVFKSCDNCNKVFCRPDVDEDSFNYEADYTKKSLHHPSSELSRLMNEMFFVIQSCLRRFPETENLKTKIKFYIDCACDFSFINCSVHKAAAVDFLKNLTCKIIINSWCNNVNRILNGKFTPYNENDLIKKQASEYFNKRRKYKRQN